jgi:hypothetical protein
MDNKNNKGKQDRIRVDSKSSSEVEYVHQQFPNLSHQAITGAVRAAGPLRKDIMAYLKKRHA